MSVSGFEKFGASSELAVVIHGMRGSREKLVHVRNVIRTAKPNSDIFVAEFPAHRTSRKDPNEIVLEIVAVIDRLCNDRTSNDAPSEEGYQSITLVGYSLGALLARKVYVYACGENADAPFECLDPSLKQPRPWAKKVRRLVLLAGMNRGWSISHHLNRLDALAWTVGIALSNMDPLRARPFLVNQIRRGAPFITQLRLQSLSMQRRAAEKHVGDAVTVQLLGTVDDMVSPSDNIDLVTGRSFVYLDVAESGHKNIHEMDDSRVGRIRQKVFARALTEFEDPQQRPALSPADEPPPMADDKVTDVVFVIHGIRDLGYWTQRIARRVMEESALASQQGGASPPRVFRTETSSYGFFAMLPFVFPWTRRDKVQWLMDQYVENRALYPNAAFSFVGHSNGTYLLAQALKDYPACRFRHVVFAGSVVNPRFDWVGMIAAGRVKRVLNYVATGDWVVAFFPKGFGMLGVRDLGGAGHDGFSFAAPKLGLSKHPAHELYQLGFVRGGHSAALAEANWSAIAQFIVRGNAVAPTAPTAPASDGELEWRSGHDWLVEAGGKAPFVVWFFIIAIAAGLGYLLYLATMSLGARWAWTVPLTIVAYLALLWRVVTRL